MRVEVFGRHRNGAAPERGLSAITDHAEALSAVRLMAWFGKIEQNGQRGHEQRRIGQRHHGAAVMLRTS